MFESYTYVNKKYDAADDVGVDVKHDSSTLDIDVDTELENALQQKQVAHILMSSCSSHSFELLALASGRVSMV